MTRSAPDALAPTEHPSPALADTIAAFSGPGASDAAPVSVPSGGERFRTRALLGEGGMGRVHDADDLQFGRRVALKELSGDGAELGRRFLVEALVTGNLEHPGIPAVYERGTREGRPFYAMKKLEGRSLGAVIAAARSLEDRLAIVPVAIQVAHTLGFAHSRGIVHRDVKPENVMVGAHGEVWVVDWGIAKVRGTSDGEPGADAIAPAGATVHGSVMGTPAYMAPEQARGDIAAIDERTDVFALGAILYHVLAGRAPYAGPTSMAALVMALEGKREPLRTLAPSAPPELTAIIDRAMAHDPKDRFADAGAMASALEKFLAHAAMARPSLAVRAIAALASVVALAIALFGTWMTVLSSSTIQEQGFGSLIVVLMSIIGLGLALLEWGTRGRYALLPLSIGIAASTFVGGIGSTFGAYGFVAREVPAHYPPSEWSTSLLQGVWEASGNAATASQLAVIQILVIAIVARAVRTRREPVRAL